MPKELPPPLPPETRTVGQLVAETIRLYGRRFWRALPLGIPPALAGVGFASLDGTAEWIWPFTAQPLAQAIALYAAVLVADRRRFHRREATVAVGVGFLAFLPVSVLTAVLVLPAAIWLAFVGLAAPAAVRERLGPRAALVRAFRLGRADVVHAFGGFAALILVGLVTTYGMFFLLRDQGEATLAAAGFLSVLVVSPLLFLGAALLYFDQAARVVDSRPRAAAARTRRRRRSDADVHPADDAERPGRADPSVEPGAAARGQP